MQNMSADRARIQGFAGKAPVVHPEAFLAEGCTVIGDVEIGEGSSVWYGAVVRADFAAIRIGRHCSIQDNVVVHPVVGIPVVIGDRVTVGHGAVLHACRIGSDVLIGMGAIVLDGAVIGEEALVGAVALVPAGTVVPPRSLVLGVPGKVVRQLDEKDRSMLRRYTLSYVALWMEPEEMAEAGLEVPEMI